MLTARRSFYLNYPRLSGTIVVTGGTSSTTEDSITSDSITTTSTSSSINSQPTDAIGAFNAIDGAYPQCAENITLSCPTLYSAVLQCWNATSPQYCFCQDLLQISCRTICTVHEQPAAYMAWIKSVCGPLTNMTAANSTVTVFSPS